MKKNIIKLSMVASLATSSLLFATMDNNLDINTSSLKSDSISSDVDAQLEKIFNGVREFHIFKQNYSRWSSTDTFTTLVTGQNGFPIFSPRSDKDPKFTDYPIDYANKIISRYRPIRPPESVKSYYTNNGITLGDKDTATYNAPIVAGGTIGKGRVLVMGSHLYGSILVNPRNYSDNVRNNNKTDTPDSPDMENFFHNVFSWLTEQNSDENNHYSKTGTPIKILSNKIGTAFWGTTYTSHSELRPFKISSNFNIETDNNPKLIPTWKKASQDGLLDPSKYPLVILEDFSMRTSWKAYSYPNNPDGENRKTQMDEVNLIVDYIRAGGGVLMMESPTYADELGVTETASNEIMKKAGVTIFFENNKQDTKILPNKTEVGGVHQYDMCVVDYIGHTDLQRRLHMDDYSNVPTTLQGLKDRLKDVSNISYLEEVLERRERKIFIDGNITTPTLTQGDCGKVEVEDANGNKVQAQTNLVKGDGIVQDGGNHDKYAKYPVDLNFVEAQGDVGGNMNTLLAHELKKNLLSSVDLKREYTNMSALLLNNAVFSGDKFQSLNDLLNKYKTGVEFVNAKGEFYPGFNFDTKDVLDFRAKPVTRIMVERAFYDKTLKYDPSQFPGQTSSTTGDATATIYLKRNTTYQKWYAGNMQSTGLYAPAHTDITVTLPDGVDETKMQLQIGVGDNVSGIFRHEINLKRPPKYVKKYKFLSGGNPTKTITVQHPYGGLIFLKSFDNTKNESDTATVSFSGVQKAVRFVLGQTTENEWNTIINNFAPKAELESKHYIVTVPKENMAHLSFAEVTKIAQDYDTMAQNAYDFYGYDQTCADTFTQNTPPTCSNDKKQAHKQREVFDPHISIGAGHSGYPIMIMSWKPKKTTFPEDPKNSFINWHEMGHNLTEGWINIPGSTEVANNVMAMYQQRKFGQPLRTEDAIKNVNIILAKGQPWADGGDFGRLLMYHQLFGWIETNYMDTFKAKNPKYYNSNGTIKSEYPFLSGDGFDIFKIMSREARDTTVENDKYDKCMKQANSTKTDMLSICTSAILELNTKPFFEAWKAGVVGIGNNRYDSTGGITSGLDAGYSTLPRPTIESYTGN